MYPGFIGYWKRAHRAAWQQACAQGGTEGMHAAHGHHGEGGPHFGVRRPLRFMAHKLELDEAQVKKLAHILDDLKTERAQAEVDDKRSVGLIAQALEGDDFAAEAARQGLELRVKSAERLRDAVQSALERTHAMLNPEQRSKLAYLLRSGALSI